MYRLIETTESIEYSIPIVGASILSILFKNRKRMTINGLLDTTYRSFPEYGEQRVVQSLIFLYSVGAIDLDEPYIEISKND
ncbi:TPA: hypothetical protein I7747_14030 [Vibrio vulnificus]|nr:hypothetical protein BWP24_16345 [Vibrio campbellii]HAS8423729.1 hypothetical protein [Vibrio vulnificus]